MCGFDSAIISKTSWSRGVASARCAVDISCFPLLAGQGEAKQWPVCRSLGVVAELGPRSGAVARRNTARPPAWRWQTVSQPTRLIAHATVIGGDVQLNKPNQRTSAMSAAHYHLGLRASPQRGSGGLPMQLGDHA